jgi:transmembrane serine protease 11D
MNPNGAGLGLPIALCCILGLAGAAQSQSAKLTPEAASGVDKALAANPEITRGGVGRIVGGEPVMIEKNPWQVALIRASMAEPQRSQFCGGSLISDSWVLTAAHCVRNSIVREDPARLNVIAGTRIYIAGGERVEVAAIHVHPQYNTSTMDSDFALLQLKTPLANVNGGAPQAIKSASENTQVSDGTEVNVTGWGATAEGGPGSLELLGALVPIVSNDVCNKPASYNGDITATMICAGREEGGVDSCQGDSGGPLTHMIDGQPVLIGVVSWGEGCARRLKYGIYSRVSAAAPWIASTAK